MPNTLNVLQRIKEINDDYIVIHGGDLIRGQVSGPVVIAMRNVNNFLSAAEQTYNPTSTYQLFLESGEHQNFAIAEPEKHLPNRIYTTLIRNSYWETTKPGGAESPIRRATPNMSLGIRAYFASNYGMEFMFTGCDFADELIANGSSFAGGLSPSAKKQPNWSDLERLNLPGLAKIG